MLVADRVLKGVYACAITVVVVAALKTPLTGQQQQQTIAQAQPQASPAQPVQPDPAQQQPQQQQQAGRYYDPALQNKVSEVRSWSPDAISAWIQFCRDTRGGQGFSQGDQLVCLAVSHIQRETQQ